MLVHMDNDDKTEILHVLNKLNHSVSLSYIDDIMDCWANNKKAQLIGSASHEIFLGWDKIKKGIKKMFTDNPPDLIERKLQLTLLELRGDVAWYSANVKIVRRKETAPLQLPLRITGVLAKEDGEWKMQQRHASYPQAGIEDGRSWPHKEGVMSAILQWIDEFNLDPELLAKWQNTDLHKYLQKAKEIMVKELG